MESNRIRLRIRNSGNETYIFQDKITFTTEFNSRTINVHFVGGESVIILFVGEEPLNEFKSWMKLSKKDNDWFLCCEDLII